MFCLLAGDHDFDLVISFGLGADCQRSLFPGRDCDDLDSRVCLHLRNRCEPSVAHAGAAIIRCGNVHLFRSASTLGVPAESSSLYRYPIGLNIRFWRRVLGTIKCVFSYADSICRMNAVATSVSSSRSGSFGRSQRYSTRRRTGTRIGWERESSNQATVHLLPGRHPWC
jgi:hypothetical protein